MNRSDQKIFNNKISLIYEYNKQTPLFVRMANIEIENNNLDTAINILQEGIRQNPANPLACFILGKAYTLTGNYKEALRLIKEGSDMIHSKRTYDFYLKEIENIKKQRTLFAASHRGNIFLPGNESYFDENQADLFNPGSQDVDHHGSDYDEESLQKLAENISTAKITIDNSSPGTEDNFQDKTSFNNVIASETLANIYIAQGEIREAIEVFEKLASKDPSKYDYYQDKIQQLKSSSDNI